MGWINEIKKNAKNIEKRKSKIFYSSLYRLCSLYSVKNKAVNILLLLFTEQMFYFAAWGQKRGERI